MDKLLARTMIETLSKGIDPLTGKLLPRSHLCCTEEIQDALWEVLDSCTIESTEQILQRQKEEKKSRTRQKVENQKQKYHNYGKPWTREEKQKLLQLNQNYNIWTIANIMGRSPKVIERKLEDLGAVPNKGHNTGHNKGFLYPF